MEPEKLESQLSIREKEVIELVKEGIFSNEKIAEKLNIKRTTVHTHFKNIYKKIDVHSKNELIYLLLKHPESLTLKSLLFNNSLIGFIEEDFSCVKKYIDSLKLIGIKDFKKYFDDNPKEVKVCADLVKRRRINDKSVSLLNYKGDKVTRATSLWSLFDDKAKKIFSEELVCFTEGGVTFSSINWHLDSSGNQFRLEIEVSIHPRYVDTWEIVLVALIRSN